MKPSQSLISRHRDRRSSYDASHGLAEHELALYAAYAPAGFDGSQVAEPLPTLTQILPTPRIVNKSVETLAQHESGGIEAARVQQYEVSQISRGYLGTDLIPLYWLVVDSATTPTPEDARDRKYPRFRLVGSPNMLHDQWQLTLIQES